MLLFARCDDSGVFKGIVKPLAIIGVAALLVAPALWSVTPILYGSQSTLPYAGPELSHSAFMGGGNASGSGMGAGFPGMGGAGPIGNSNLIPFLMDHMGSERYMVAVPNAMSASEIIIETGMPVMAVGGFIGSDPILTAESLEKMVADGEIRYYLTMGTPDFSAFTMPVSNTSGSSTDNRFQPGSPVRQSIARCPECHGAASQKISEWVEDPRDTGTDRKWMGNKAIMRLTGLAPAARLALTGCTT